MPLAFDFPHRKVVSIVEAAARRAFDAVMTRAIDAYNAQVEEWSWYIIANGWEPSWFHVQGKGYLGWHMPDGSVAFAWPQPSVEFVRG